MRTHLRTTAYVVVALLVGAALAATWVHADGRARRAETARAAEEARRILAEEELARVRREYYARWDSVQVENGRRLEAVQTEQRRLADAQRDLRERIPPPVEGTVEDSLRYWRATAESALLETLDLRAALALADSIRTTDTLRIRRMSDEWLRSEQRGDTLAATLQRLVRTIPVAEPPCRIAYILPCPSRTTATAVGMAVGYYLADRRQEDRRKDD